jgi:hypothetical protein
MEELLFALAQVVSVLLLVAGFVLVTWHGWSGPSDDQPDD